MFYKWTVCAFLRSAFWVILSKLPKKEQKCLKQLRFHFSFSKTPTESLFILEPQPNRKKWWTSEVHWILEKWTSTGVTSGIQNFNLTKKQCKKIRFSFFLHWNFLSQWLKQYKIKVSWRPGYQDIKNLNTTNILKRPQLPIFQDSSE